MNDKKIQQLYTGHCTCGFVHYFLSDKPLFVNCCHCTWCQRETGSAFVINAIIENDNVHVTKGEIEIINTPSKSGRGQKIARCPQCHVALWSHYSPRSVSFVRVGTLTQPHNIEPMAHIYTSTKVSWVKLPEEVPTFKGFYDIAKQWPKESLARIALIKN